VEGKSRSSQDRRENHHKKFASSRLDPETERLYRQMTEQYNNALLEAKRLKEEEKNLKDQINLYQRRIEDTQEESKS